MHLPTQAVRFAAARSTMLTGRQLNPATLREKYGFTALTSRVAGKTAGPDPAAASQTNFSAGTVVTWRPCLVRTVFVCIIKPVRGPLHTLACRTYHLMSIAADSFDNEDQPPAPVVVPPVQGGKHKTHIVHGHAFSVCVAARLRGSGFQSRYCLHALILVLAILAPYLSTTAMRETQRALS